MKQRRWLQTILEESRKDAPTMPWTKVERTKG